MSHVTAIDPQVDALPLNFAEHRRDEHARPVPVDEVEPGNGS
jgi:hypothetical protein